jgi:hypothetical protein
MAVMLRGLLYLVLDTNTLVRNKRTSWKRVGQTLSSALLVSALAGLLVVSLTSLANTGPEYEQVMHWYFLGPFGWVNLYHYFLFVPLALFTGLVTQFIFEEQSVTASVWAAEQE